MNWCKNGHIIFAGSGVCLIFVPKLFRVSKHLIGFYYSVSSSKMNFNKYLVGEFGGKGIKMGIRIPLTSDLNLNREFTHDNVSSQGNKEFHYSVCVKERIV